MDRRHRVCARRATEHGASQAGHARADHGRAGRDDGRAHAGEQVITDGAAWLTDGRAVHVVTGTRAEPVRIWAFAVRRWQFTLLLFGLLIAVGFNTLQNIPRAEDPEFHAPVPTVIVAYPGADPADIERLIVDPIEDAINELDDIKRMDSRSLDGVAVIQIEFHWDQDPEEKYDEVVREVNRIRPALPPDIASLEVRKAGSGLVNIVQLALVSPDATYRDLRNSASR